MRKPLLKARQLLLLAYLLAAVLWVVRCLVGCGVMLNYKLQGKMPQTHVDAAELVTESFAPYSSNEWWTPPDDDPAWYLSTDTDPHIYWQGQGYIETAVLDASLPAVMLYEHRGYKTTGHGVLDVGNDVKLVYEMMEKQLRA